jgi:hypothetical protein
MVRSAARRVSNHEGTQVDRWPPILRDGPSGLLRMRRVGDIGVRKSSNRSLFPVSRCQTAMHLSLRTAVLHAAAPCGVRVLPSSFKSAPETRGWRSADRRTLLLCRACEARRPRERNAGRPVATGTPLSALRRGDFRPGTRAAASGSGTGADERPARVRPYDLMGGVPDLPRCGSRRIARRHTPLRFQDRF